MPGPAKPKSAYPGTYALSSKQTIKIQIKQNKNQSRKTKEREKVGGTFEDKQAASQEEQEETNGMYHSSKKILFLYSFCGYLQSWVQTCPETIR